MERRRTGHRLATPAIALLLSCGASSGLASMAPGARGDGVADLFVGGRDLIIHTDGTVVNGFILTSDSALLDGDPYTGPLGLFTTDDDGLLADQFGYTLTGLHDLGRILSVDHGLGPLALDLTMSYTVEGQAGTFYATILQASPGDTDLDGDVDNADIGKAAGSFTGAGGSASMNWTDGDMDGDGDVDNADLGLIAGAFTGAQAGGATVPEPASLALLAVAGWALPRRRRAR